MVDIDIAKQVYKDYKKAELLSIARELELDVSVQQRAVSLSKMILKDLEDNGIPDTEDCSDELYELLVMAKYIDDDGNITEDDEEDLSENNDTEEVEDTTQGLPECYSLADSRDPACSRCRVYDDCLKSRISNHPDCFGKLYEKHSEECGVCIEAPQCKIILEGV